MVTCRPLLQYLALRYSSPTNNTDHRLSLIWRNHDLSIVPGYRSVVKPEQHRRCSCIEDETRNGALVSYGSVYLLAMWFSMLGLHYST